MRRISYLLVVLLSAGVLLAAGCGGDDDDDGGGSGAAPAATEESSGGGGGGEALTLTADPGGAISWDKSELTAKAGTVTITLVNDSDVPHAVEIEGNGVEEESETVTGGEAEVSADLKAGEYEYYCPVGSHRQTMTGTLTVE
ncbi:MAG TPA: cupredoxin domain-containing protein [Solirubrobacteraceae bacterium]|jgi:plastocyanin|nr:cupredoxin domain-containing protein [Solirubrobacteraceae bacterium]